MNLKKIAINLISKFRCQFINKQDFFIIKTNKSNFNQLNGRVFYDIDNINDFNMLCQKYSFFVPDADIDERFRQKQHFCLVAEDKHFGCWGWYTTTEQSFAVSEINRSSKVPLNTTVLFHFFTNIDYRRKGYYNDLLRFIVSTVKKDYAIIYAYDTNPASSNAIRKVGFKFAGRMNHKSFISFNKMIDKTYREAH